MITNQFFIENMAQESEDPETTALIRQREEERLKKMTFYCFTHECLRDYILRYFGEYGSNYCGNCSSCLSEFETVDATATAKAILGCVRECRQRYGTTVILDTLHGANTAKIRFSFAQATMPFAASTWQTLAPALAQATVAPPV